MGLFPARAMERAMKVQEVILRAMSGQIKWFEAAPSGHPVFGCSYQSLGLVDHVTHDVTADEEGSAWRAARVQRRQRGGRFRRECSFHRRTSPPQPGAQTH